MTHLLVTVRFLDDRYHGLLDRGGPPEWPPSPFRLFQALVAGVARRGELVDGDDTCLCATCKAVREHRGMNIANEPDKTRFKPIGQALDWLQRHTRGHPPIIIAPKSKPGQATMRYGPDNDGDNEKFQANPEQFRTGKHTQATLFLPEPGQKAEVHYVWDVSGDCANAKSHERSIERAARSLTTLGWGIDMAFADARLADEAELQQLKGVRWHPKNRDWPFRDTLRTPTYDDKLGECTLCDLRHCHSTFINRIEHGKPLKTVDKPKVFDRVLYTSIERPIARPARVFKLLDLNEDPARYPHAKLMHIAGMVRHVAIERMKNDPPSWKREDPTWVERFVCGHRGDVNQHQQISYVPLPSVGQHADAMIRNIMLVAPIECERELDYIAERMADEELKPENQVRSIGLCKSQPVPGPMFLERFTPPSGKFIDKRYLGTSQSWHTVTPVILPGYDDHRPAKTIKLIQRALSQSGIEQRCEFEWGALPNFPNCLPAYKYDRNKRPTGYFRPDHLKDYTVVHLRIRFDTPFSGPLVIGAGRHCGFGLLAAAE